MRPMQNSTTVVAVFQCAAQAGWFRLVMAKNKETQPVRRCMKIDIVTVLQGSAYAGGLRMASSSFL